MRALLAVLLIAVAGCSIVEPESTRLEVENLTEREFAASAGLCETVPTIELGTIQPGARVARAVNPGCYEVTATFAHAAWTVEVEANEGAVRLVQFR